LLPFSPEPLPFHLLPKNIKNRIYKTIILPVVLYECETWSLTLREEHRLRMLGRIFGPKRDEVTGGWRKMHNEEFHKLHSKSIVVRMIKSWRARARIGEDYIQVQDIGGKARGKETTRKIKT
jgi:hypothetical protein